MLFIYTTCATSDEAEGMGKLIIGSNMAACVDYWPVESMFHWEGKFKKISQIMIVISTFESKLDDLTELISLHHSYSIPLVAGLDVRRINRPYKEWMMKEVA